MINCVLLKAGSDDKLVAQRLENAQIHARLDKISSEYEPLESLINKLESSDISMERRDLVRGTLYRAAFYVVYGRVPD